MKNLYLLTIAIFALAVSACGGDDIHLHFHENNTTEQEDTEENSVPSMNNANVGNDTGECTTDDECPANELCDVRGECREIPTNTVDDPDMGFETDTGTESDTGEEDAGMNADTGEDLPGRLTVELSSVSPKGDIIPGNITDAATSVYTFQAENEAMVVDAITLVNCIGYNGDNDCQDADEVPGDHHAIDRIHVSYPNVNGDWVTVTRYLNDNVVIFAGLDIYVPANGQADLLVSVTTQTVSEQWADSGDRFALSMVDSGVYTGASGFTLDAEFEAIGVRNGHTITDFGGVDNVAEGLPASTFVLRRTRPTLSLNAGSPSGAGVFTGFNELFRFNVSADPRGFVTMEKIMFAVVATDADYGNDPNSWTTCGPNGLNDPSKWYFGVDGNAYVTDVQWKFFNHLGEPCADGDQLYFVQADFTQRAYGPLEVAAGSTKTWRVEVDTTGASSADDDSIRVDIPSEYAVDSSPGFNPDIHHAIQWGDDWYADGIDGTYVDNLPIRGGTIIY